MIETTRVPLYDPVTGKCMYTGKSCPLKPPKEGCYLVCRTHHDYLNQIGQSDSRAPDSALEE